MDPTTARSDVLEKVQKVLAMTESPNVNEAEVAMSMVKSLMEKYQVSMDELSLIKNKKENIIEEEFGTGLDHPRNWARSLAYSVSKLYDCRIIRRGGTFIFIGFELDAKIATQMMGYLYWGTIHASRVYLERRDDRGYGNSIKITTDFCIGASQSLNDRIDKIIVERNKSKEKDCTALIIVKADAINKYMKDEYSHLKTSSIQINNSVDLNAFSNGIDHGNRVVLNNPLKGGKI